MNTADVPTSLSSFRIPLGLKAHQQADQYRQYHQGNKAKQVYLNTLAIMAVQDYLAMMGYSWDWSESFSSQATQQTLMDCADLLLPNLGRIECRYCWDNDIQIQIPPEALSERLGVIVVQLNTSLREAHILGFSPALGQKPIALSSLRPLTELYDWLSANEPQPKITTQLIHWQQQIQDTWTDVVLTVDFFLNPSQLSPEFRQLASSSETLTPDLCRSKRISIEGREMDIFIGLQTLSSEETEIWVMIRSPQTGEPLPLELNMKLLDAQEAELMGAQSNGTEAIQFRFSAHPKETFQILVQLNQGTWRESFTL